MDTTTQEVALIEGIYTCFECGEKDVFGVQDPLPPCPKCGERAWDCQIDDHRPDDWVPIPMMFFHGTMSFVIAVSDEVQVGDRFNIRLRTQSRTASMGGEESDWTTHDRMNGCYEIAGQFDNPAIRLSVLNGYDGYWVNLMEVGPIDRSQMVHVAFPC